MTCGPFNLKLVLYFCKYYYKIHEASLYFILFCPNGAPDPKLNHRKITLC
jgi:hypothetical protein